MKAFQLCVKFSVNTKPTTLKSHVRIFTQNVTAIKERALNNFFNFLPLLLERIGERRLNSHVNHHRPLSMRSTQGEGAISLSLMAVMQNVGTSQLLFNMLQNRGLYVGHFAAYNDKLLHCI